MLQRSDHRAEGGDNPPAGRSLHPVEQIRFAAAAEMVARRRMRQDDDVGLDHRQELDAAVDIIHHHLVAFVWPSSEPPVPRAVMRWKCSETPSGANAIIS